MYNYFASYKDVKKHLADVRSIWQCGYPKKRGNDIPFSVWPWGCNCTMEMGRFHEVLVGLFTVIDETLRDKYEDMVI